MTRYRIYTERKPNIGKLTSKYFAGFTIYNGTGYWKGKREQCAVIEIIENELLETTLNVLVADLKKTNNQEAVYVTSENVTANLY